MKNQETFEVSWIC